LKTLFRPHNIIYTNYKLKSNKSTRNRKFFSKALSEREANAVNRTEDGTLKLLYPGESEITGRLSGLCTWLRK